jgi:hypothetical protein
MNKRAEGLMMIVILLILALLLLYLLKVGFLDRIKDASNNMVSCKAKGGECGPPNQQREVVGYGYWADCEKEYKGKPYVCYYSEEWLTADQAAEAEPPSKGINFRVIRYDGIHETTTSTVFKEYANPGSILSAETLHEGENQPIKLYAGRLYAFQAYIMEGAQFCSLYIRTTAEIRAGSGNIVSGTVSKAPCDIEKHWNTIYFVPGSNDRDLYLVLLERSSLTDTSMTSKKRVIPLQIEPVPSLSVASFAGPKTNVNDLKTMKYLEGDKKVSFILDNEFGTVEFKDVTFSRTDNLDFNFDYIFKFSEFGVLVQGKKLDYISSSGPNALITLKNTKITAPPAPKLGLYDFDVPSAEKDRFAMCELCQDVQSAGKEVTFRAMVVGRNLQITPFPGSCDGLDKTMCKDSSYALKGLECQWKNNKCLACDTQTNLVKECKNYDDTAFCNDDECNIGPCVWTKKFWILKDGCVSCNDKKECKDYKNQDACDRDLCGTDHYCKWSATEEKCISCDSSDVKTCSDYTKISNAAEFCREDVCILPRGCMPEKKKCVSQYAISDGTA